MKTRFTLLLLTLLSTPSYADERWYQVELLIFANNSAQGLIGERWRAPTPNATRDAHLTLAEAIADDRHIFKTVAESDKKLLASAAKMRTHWQTRPLLYSAWRQKFTLDAAPIPVYLSNDNVIKQADRFGQSASRFNQKFGDGFSSNDVETTNNEPILELSGTAAVTLKRYLHLELNLNYNRLLNSQDNEQVRAIYQSLGTDYLSFKISELRRMRSKQAHYFDHPAFGVVALITPVETTTNTKKQSEQLKIETLPASDNNSADKIPLQ